MSRKKISYCQCLLERRVSDTAVLKQVAYIPKKFAVKSKLLKIKDAKDQWESGWVVKNVGNELREDQLPDSHSQIKGHRMNTGDAG